MQTLSCFETYHWHIIVLRNSWSNHTLWAKERLTQHTINHFFPTFLGKIRWNDQIKVLVTQLCPTLCNSKNCSPPGSSVHEIVQARLLEWVAIPFSRGSSWSRDRTQVLALQADSTVAQTVKNLSTVQETLQGLIPGSGRSLGDGNGYPLQYSSMNRGPFAYDDPTSPAQNNPQNNCRQNLCGLVTWEP